MPQPAARRNDAVTGTDMHLVVVPGSSPVSTPHPFVGRLSGALAVDVFIDGQAAATQGSTAEATVPHLPIGGVSFTRPPSNAGTVQLGSPSVLVNNKPVARLGDPVITCNDPIDLPTSSIASGSPDVFVA